MNASLIESVELEQTLPKGEVTVVDCSWFVPEAGKSGKLEFERQHIPGARYFDLSLASDPASPYANMLPAAERFAAVVGALGISNNTKVVIYDSGYVSARVWWMFNLFGHHRVRVLNGGLRRWLAEQLGLPELPRLPVLLHSRVKDGRPRDALAALSAAFRSAVRG